MDNELDAHRFPDDYSRIDTEKKSPSYFRPQNFNTSSLIGYLGT
jgi:hypothetical protein